jgi:SAM-dependent MidA family methyltransferase
MDLALYDSEVGYYARAPQRSGRAGDFFTSVDVGPIFGELLAVQIAEMARILHSKFQIPNSFDLIEAGAGNGRLSADILRALRLREPALYDRVRLHLVEASAAARDAQRATLDEVVGRLASSSAGLPASFDGVLIANELLDALPVHQVVMRADGLREVYVSARGPNLRTLEGPPSTPALAAYLNRLGITLEPGWRAEINLRAVGWIRDAARRVGRGFIIIIDYGHEAGHLYSPAHADGTLTAFARHTMGGPESTAGAPPWLQCPGERDITAHVDFTSVRAAAEGEGLETLGFLDQTYFLMGILGASPECLSNLPNLQNLANLANLANLGNRLALKTLIMPGGLGSTHKVLILGKGVGAPALRGCSFRTRVT